eukprot:7731906-Pyramimonas_sp.AAC.1
MRSAPLEPSVELPMGPRGAALGGETACALRPWDLLWRFSRSTKRRTGCGNRRMRKRGTRP